MRRLVNQLVIGVELHAQVSAKTKLFSACKTDWMAAPNTAVSVVDLGLPGTLPVLNAESVKQVR